MVGVLQFLYSALTFDDVLLANRCE